MPSGRDAEQVAAYLRGLPPLGVPESLAGHERIFLRARLLGRLASTRGPASRGERPLWLAGLFGPVAAGIALLLLFVRGLTGAAAARDPVGLALAGLAPLVAIALAAGLALAAAIVLPLVLAEE
jgi:hypothetical protein